MKESGAWRAACKMLAAAGDQAHALVVRMVGEGTLPAGMMWVGLSGAAAFVKAIARGDIAPLEVHEARDRECLRCGARTPVKNADGFERRGFVGYCGEPLVEWMGGPRRYSAERGAPMLRRRHQPFDIDETAREAWLACMRQALERVGVDARLRQELEAAFAKIAAHLVNTR